MNNVLLWIGGLLVAVLCALFAVPHFVDWTRYRGVFEEEASRVLGRDLRVAGAVNLRLLPTPYVRFEKIRLSDAAGQTGEPFFRADDFTLWLAPGPLLRGAIEAREVELRKPTLKLRLNAEGGGNWQTLSIAKGSLPFVPSDVALQSVQVTDGTISIDDADGRELIRSGGISGELSVTAMEGPYRFKGSFDWAGSKQDIKLATTALDAEGNLRLKVQTGVPVRAGTLSFDGRLADIAKRIRLEGQFSSRMDFDPAGLGRSAVAGSAGSANQRRLPVEVRGAVEANADGAKLTDVNFAFEHDDKPQLVAATAEVIWRGGLATRAAVTSRWLDFDRLLGDQGGRPLEGMRRLSAALGHLLPSTGSARATIDIDQVTLGGEALSDLHFDVEREGAALRLAGLRLNLPGGTRASLSGLLPSPDSLDGEVSLRGANFARFLAWMGYPATGDSRAEGIFSLKSRLAFDQQSVTVKDAIASLGNALLSGGIAYKWIDRPRLDVVLDGDQIDLGLFSPQALDLVAMARQVGGFDEAAKAPAGSALKIRLDPKTQDTTLRIRAGRLVDAERDLRDVELDASLIDGRVGVKRMRFTTAAGLELDAEGALADVGTQPRGEFRGTLGIADAASASELVELFAQPSEGEVSKRLRSLAPARVAWMTKLSGPKASATPVIEVSLDGQVLGRRLTANGRFDGRISDWRQGQVALSAAVDRPDWQRLRQLLEGDGATVAKIAPAPGSAKSRLQFKTSGRPVEQLATYLKLEDEAFDAGWSGNVTFGPDKLKSVDGEMQIRTADVLQAWTTLGLPPRNLPGIAIEGAADVAFKDEVYRITPSALEVAGAVIGGELTIGPAKELGRRRVDGKLAVSRLSIPRLLDLFVDGKTQASAGAELWQSAGFDFSLIDRIDGSVRIDAGEMYLTPDLGLQKGTIEAEASGSKLTIKTLDGDMLGARLASRWVIEKAAAGATMSGTGKIDGVNLALLPRAQGRIDGTAAVSFSTAGRGISPRSIVSSMSGKGELRLTKAWVAGLSTIVLRRLGEETITGRREPTVEAVEKAVAAMIADNSARVQIGDRRIAFEVGDGAVKLEPYRVDTPDGRASNRTTIDLARLMIDSEWKIDAVAPKAVVVPGVPEPKATSNMLPPAAIAFVGPIAALGKLEPVVSVDSLVRELSVRRMEHDVAELERLRRLDEERAKVEAERRKAEEAARQAAAASAAATAAIPPAETSPAQPAAATAGPSPVPPAATDPVEGSSPAVAISADPAQAPPPAAAGAAPKRTVGSEQRQVPSSQELKKARIQDVFKRQESGGN